MPCFYFDKKQLKNTPSFNGGLDPDTEAQYRRDGARFIIDAGNQLGLRHDSCATGVVYYHRFYMYHSFKEFNKFLVSSTCLFLAGKVEETPKKCRDIIRVARSKLKEADFASFGSDPKEELMLMERVLLQTIKFDLMLEHPYAYLLRYAKQLKGDKEKKDKMVQMAWTFINDSLCTTLSLQWEPDIIGVATIYLASRLSKFAVTDWEDKKGFKGKWYEFFVPDINMDLIEDVCHQILDLYSQQKKNEAKKAAATDRRRPAESSSPATGSSEAVAAKMQRTSSPGRAKHGSAQGPGGPAPVHDRPVAAAQQRAEPPQASLEYGSSFMTREGSENIQSLLGGGRGKPTAHGALQYPSVAVSAAATYVPSAAPQYSGQYPANTQASGTAPAAGYYQQHKQYPVSSYQQPTPASYPAAAAGSYSQQYPAQHASHKQPAQSHESQQPITQHPYTQPQSGFSQQQYTGSGFQAPGGQQQYQPRYGTPPQPTYPAQRHKAHAPGAPGIVRISR